MSRTAVTSALPPQVDTRARRRLLEDYPDQTLPGGGTMRNLVYGAALSIVGLLVVMFVYPLSNAQRHFDLDAVPTDSPRTVLIPLPSNGFDPTEVAVPWRILKGLKHRIVFATPDGKPSGGADPYTLTGFLFGSVMKIHDEPSRFYSQLLQSSEYLHPIAYTDIDPQHFDGMILPGGHHPDMKSYLDNTVLHQKAAHFWKLKRPVGAICHGVLVLARARNDITSLSVIFNSKTTTVPMFMERQAVWATSLAGYSSKKYQLSTTYPLYTEQEVRQALKFHGDKGFRTGPYDLLAPMMHGSHYDHAHTFLVEDGHYLSARFPGDAYAFSFRFARKLNEMALKGHGSHRPIQASSQRVVAPEIQTPARLHAHANMPPSKRRRAAGGAAAANPSKDSAQRTRKPTEKDKALGKTTSAKLRNLRAKAEQSQESASKGDSSRLPPRKKAAPSSGRAPKPKPKPRAAKRSLTAEERAKRAAAQRKGSGVGHKQTAKKPTPTQQTRQQQAGAGATPTAPEAPKARPNSHPPQLRSRHAPPRLARKSGRGHLQRPPPPPPGGMPPLPGGPPRQQPPPPPRATVKRSPEVVKRQRQHEIHRQHKRARQRTQQPNQAQQEHNRQAMDERKHKHDRARTRAAVRARAASRGPRPPVLKARSQKRHPSHNIKREL